MCSYLLVHKIACKSFKRLNPGHQQGLSMSSFKKTGLQTCDPTIAVPRSLLPTTD